MLTFDKDNLKKKLSSLSHKKRIVFGASCCERMLPNYKKFEEIEKWGKTQFLRDLLDKVWDHCKSDLINKKDVDSFIKKCYKVIPDEEDFDTIYTSYAIDAASAICSLLEVCVEDDIDNLISIAELSLNTIDLFVQEEDNMDSRDPNLEEKILMTPLMQRELKKQNDDIETLNKIQIIDERFINEFRSSVEGKSNIQI
ncbi:DUF416 family protein [Acetivibrio clariflavus]|uniref:DUF416 family protein n=1 Tax=Acetivibrio clariflavus TaxID=288965 RepID=UPI0031F5D82D